MPTQVPINAEKNKNALNNPFGNQFFVDQTNRTNLGVHK